MGGDPCKSWMVLLVSLKVGLFGFLLWLSPQWSHILLAECRGVFEYCLPVTKSVWYVKDGYVAFCNCFIVWLRLLYGWAVFYTSGFYRGWHQHGWVKHLNSRMSGKIQNPEITKTFLMSIYFLRAVDWWVLSCLKEQIWRIPPKSLHLPLL